MLRWCGVVWVWVMSAVVVCRGVACVVYRCCANVCVVCGCCVLLLFGVLLRGLMY